MNVTSKTKLHPEMSRKEAVRAFRAMREELARVEAERDALRDERDRYHGLACRLLRQRGDLRRQVAELEAALAAQQWRPGNEKPDATGWYQTIEAEDCYSHAAFDGAVWQGYPGNNPPLFWRPIPPTASETTP